MSIEAHLEEPCLVGENHLGPKRKLHLDAPEERSSGNAMNAVVHDLSEAGLLLQTSAQLSVGERIEVVLPHASQEASVAWGINDFFACRFERRTGRAAPGGARRRNGEQLASPAPGDLAKPGNEAAGEEAFGTRLRRLRQDKGISLVGLAGLVDVSKPTVWKWETRKARPRQRVLEALASALEVSEQELLYGNEPAALGARESASAARDASSLSDLISDCKGRIAELAGISIDKVSITVSD
jgi:transcriptional regulator with XRE-family HTH domain